MQRVLLPNTKIESSRLGFGCVGLTVGNDRRHARRLLEIAFDHGVTHYDTARAYGMGHSEGILGEFLRDKRDKITVTTKLGIEPYSPPINTKATIKLAKAVLRRFPKLEARAKRYVQRQGKSSAFHPTEAAQSLTQSLKALRTDYVDILLLHECTLDEARNEAITAFLASELERGTVRSVGIGSDRCKLANNIRSLPALYSICQFGNNPLLPSLDQVAGAQERAIVTHSALHPLRYLSSTLAQERPMVSRYSEHLGADLSDPSVVSLLLLEYSLTMNPDGVVLFATTQERNLLNNLRAADCRSTTAQLIDFALFVRDSAGGYVAHGAEGATPDAH